MTEVRISRVTTANAAALDHVASGVFNDPVDPQRLEAYLAFPASMLIVAMDGDLVVGQLMAAINMHPNKPADLYVDEIAVAPTHRRRGIARNLLEEAETWARERGCIDIWLAADIDNDVAHVLYESFAGSKRAILYFWDLGPIRPATRP